MESVRELSPVPDAEFGHGSERADLGSSSDDYARRFDGALGRYLLEVQAEKVLELLSPWPGASVLDVGGGHAQLAGPLREAGHHVTVLGSAVVGSRRLRRLEPGTPFVAGSLIDLPFGDGSFDVAIAVRLLAHVPDWRALVRGLSRVSRRGVVVDFATQDGVHALAPLFFDLKKRFDSRIRPYHSFSRAQVEQEFARNGLGLARCRPQFFWPMALHRLGASPQVSGALEFVPRSLGLTDRLGSPVLLCAEREEPAP